MNATPYRLHVIRQEIPILREIGKRIEYLCVEQFENPLDAYEITLNKTYIDDVNYDFVEKIMTYLGETRTHIEKCDIVCKTPDFIPTLLRRIVADRISAAAPVTKCLYHMMGVKPLKELEVADETFTTLENARLFSHVMYQFAVKLHDSHHLKIGAKYETRACGPDFRAKVLEEIGEHSYYSQMQRFGERVYYFPRIGDKEVVIYEKPVIQRENDEVATHLVVELAQAGTALTQGNLSKLHVWNRGDIMDRFSEPPDKRTYSVTIAEINGGKQIDLGISRWQVSSDTECDAIINHFVSPSVTIEMLKLVNYFPNVTIPASISFLKIRRTHPDSEYDFNARFVYHHFKTIHLRDDVAGSRVVELFLLATSMDRLYCNVRRCDKIDALLGKELRAFKIRENVSRDELKPDDLQVYIDRATQCAVKMCRHHQKIEIGSYYEVKYIDAQTSDVTCGGAVWEAMMRWVAVNGGRLQSDDVAVVTVRNRIVSISRDPCVLVTVSLKEGDGVEGKKSSTKCPGQRDVPLCSDDSIEEGKEEREEEEATGTSSVTSLKVTDQLQVDVPKRLKRSRPDERRGSDDSDEGEKVSPMKKSPNE